MHHVSYYRLNIVYMLASLLGQFALHIPHQFWSEGAWVLLHNDMSDRFKQRVVQGRLFDPQHLS
jgi:hypothetical protein